MDFSIENLVLISVFIFIPVFMIVALAYVNHKRDGSTSEVSEELTTSLVKTSGSELPVKVTLNMLIELLIGLKTIKEPTTLKSTTSGNTLFIWSVYPWRVVLTFNTDGIPIRLGIDAKSVTTNTLTDK